MPRSSGIFRNPRFIYPSLLIRILLLNQMPETGLLNQNFWLLRLDSLGCLEAGCDTVNNDNPILTSNTSAISIYPNPLTNEGVIQINLDHFDLTDVSYLEFEIRNLTGQIVKEFTIDKFHWNIIDNNLKVPLFRETFTDGIYLVQIKTSFYTLGNAKVLFM